MTKMPRTIKEMVLFKLLQWGEHYFTRTISKKGKGDWGFIEAGKEENEPYGSPKEGWQ
jgi:hypothetical protein